jgi:hypothetical protein
MLDPDDPDAHRIEQCGGSQCGGSHGNRHLEREHARGQQHEPGVTPISNPVTIAWASVREMIRSMSYSRYFRIATAMQAGSATDPSAFKTVNAALTGSDGVGSRVETVRFTIPPRVKGTDLRHAGSYRVAILPARR